MNKEEIIKQLNEFKDKLDDDNIRFKEIVKQRLYTNELLIHVLHSLDLNEDSPDEYLGVNIRPSLIIPETQTKPTNYICYKSDFEEHPRYNDFYKIGVLTFVIMCPEEDMIDSETGIARHDLLGAIIKKIFNYTNIFGMQLKCISDRESTTDTHYATRTVIFELTSPNNIYKDNKVINKSVVKV